ncbi:MAG TPA: hypothetical protein VGL66_06725 [Caulobacteraceae bacterium]|jgi:hypothetical protein
MRWILGWAVAGAVVALGGCDVRDALSGKAELTGKVKEVVDRTHTTRTSYSVYYSNWTLNNEGVGADHWTAEFHDGVHHRVETADLRLVADCQALTGSGLSVGGGPSPLTGAAAARAACGIDANIPVTDFAYLGVVDTPWGSADRVRLTNDAISRIYDINKDGVIVGERWYKNAPGHATVLKQTIFALTSSVSSPDMFEEASLNKSFTPDQYKTTPGLQVAATIPGHQ